MVITSKTNDQLVNQYLRFIRKINEHFTRQLLLKLFQKNQFKDQIIVMGNK
jgi:hypothetical protein